MNKEEIWGLTLSIDLYDCDLAIITSKDDIIRYALEICELIKMKRYGETIVEYFGQEEKVKGYSLVQLIETSSITGHFCNQKKSVYIDIFSCKEFSIKDAVQFTKTFFKAQSDQHNILFRK